MGLFASFFPGITGFNPAFEAPMTGMFMAAPPAIQQSLMKQFGGLRSATGPFETVMHQAFASAPPEVQSWARDYAGAHKMGFMANILGAAPAPPAAHAGNDPYSALEQKFGLPPGYLARTAHIESGGNPHASNPSGATGVFQFMPGTAAAYGVNANDAASSAAGAAHLAADNAKILARVLGRAPSASELYLAHQQGAAGAAGLLAHPNAPAASVIGVKALLANGGDAGMTAGQFANMWMGRFDSTGHADIPIRQISSNPDAALVHAAGMASPSDPGPGAGISSPMVPASAPLALPGAPGAPPGPFAGGNGMQIGALTSNPPHEIQASGPLEAAGAAQQANMNARKMMDFLMPVPADTATTGKAVPNVFGDAATNPAAAEGLFQRLFARPKLADNTGGVRYRA